MSISMEEKKKVINYFDKDLILPLNLGSLKEYGQMILRDELNFDILDDFILLNYSKEIIHKKIINDNLFKARGLILRLSAIENADIDNVIVTYPFYKFVNLTNKISQGDIDEITIKYDGALMVSYWDNNRVKWASRNCLDSKIVKIANDIWEENHQRYFDEYLQEYTLMCELIHPISQIVIKNESEQLVLIGSISKVTGREMDRRELEELGKKLNIKVVEKVNYTLNEILPILNSFTVDQEGFVIKLKNGERIKLSSPIYNGVYDLLSVPSIWMISEVWGDWENPYSLLKYIPSSSRKYIFNEFEKLEILLDEFGQKDEVKKNFRKGKEIHNLIYKFLESDL